MGTYNPFVASAQDHELNKQSARAMEQDALFNAGQRRREGERLMGEQIAAYGASGVEMDGTPQAVVEEDFADAQVEAMNIIYSGRNNARVMKQKSKIQRDQSNFNTILSAGQLGLSGYKASK